MVERGVRRFRRWLGPAVVVGATLSIALGSGVANASSAPSTRVALHGPGDRFAGSLYAVSADPTGDVWAVGASASGPDGTLQTLALHRVGSTWSRAWTPDPGALGDSLLGVSVRSSSDAWAVGFYIDGDRGGFHTLIAHFDGTRWARVASPSPGTTYNSLDAVTATSATDAWAVGEYVDHATGAHRSLILHWDGATWSQVVSPNPSASLNSLEGVSASSATDAWATGDFVRANGTVASFVLHWNGVRWSPSPVMNLSRTVNDLSAVSVQSSKDVLAVGYGRRDLTGTFRGLSARWDGTAWATMAAPTPVHGTNVLEGVSASSATDAWAVGNYIDRAAGATAVLILHWDGTRWTRLANPDPAHHGRLAAVSAVTPTDAWAVGSVDGETGTQTLVLHWDGTDWATA